jgi:hypothetical protein
MILSRARRFYILILNTVLLTHSISQAAQRSMYGGDKTHHVIGAHVNTEFYRFDCLESGRSRYRSNFPVIVSNGFLT